MVQVWLGVRLDRLKNCFLWARSRPLWKSKSAKMKYGRTSLPGNQGLKEKERRGSVPPTPDEPDTHATKPTAASFSLPARKYRRPRHRGREERGRRCQIKCAVYCVSCPPRSVSIPSCRLWGDLSRYAVVCSCGRCWTLDAGRQTEFGTDACLSSPERLDYRDKTSKFRRRPLLKPEPENSPICSIILSRYN